MDQTNLVQTIIPEGQEIFALNLVNTKLSGKARSFITVTDEHNTIALIQDSLRNNTTVNSSAFYIGKLKLARQGGRDFVRFAVDLEELTNSLSQAYISEGFALQNTQTLEKNVLIESVKVIK